MTDHKLQYTPEGLREHEMKLRDNLFMWATMEPPVPGATPAKITNAFGNEITYIEMGDELRSRLDAILSLQRAHKDDILNAENDRAHLGEHQEQGKPLETWELELMGLRKVGDMKYEVVCKTCADNTKPAEYWGRKLEWHMLDTNQLTTQMPLDFAVQARDSHLDMYPDHDTTLELI